MANVKTAISIPETLFEQVESLARKHEISRSRLFTLAIQEFIRRYENRDLLDATNAANDDFPSPEERTQLRRMRRRQRQLVEGQW